MFNNLISRNLDLVVWGSSYVPPKPIFIKGVANALDCVLHELIQVARGERLGSEFPVAIKKFQSYLREAQRIFRGRYLRIALLRLNSLSFEQEAGCRMACHFEYMINSGGESWKRPSINYGLIPDILAWLSGPTVDDGVAKSLEIIRNFNSKLDDYLVREEFLENPDWLRRY